MLKMLSAVLLGMIVQVAMSSNAFAQSQRISKLIVQSYVGSTGGFDIRELTYTRHGSFFVADSLLISETDLYLTKEQYNAARRKKKKDKTFQKPIRGLSIIVSDRKNPVYVVQHVNDTIKSALIDESVSKLNELEDRTLMSLGITGDDIDSYVAELLKGRHVRYALPSDSLVQFLSPEYRIDKKSIDSCNIICMVQSHGGTRYGFNIFTQNENGARIHLTQTDRCNVLPLFHFINLFFVLESFPDELFYNRRLVGKRMLLDFVIAQIAAKLEGRQCMVRVLGGR